MPINDNVPFAPTHEPAWGDFYVASTSFSGTASTGGIATYSSSTEELIKTKKLLDEEVNKRIMAEAKVEVLNVKLENKVEGKEADEDEIERLENLVSRQQKMIHDITFLIAEMASTSTASGTYGGEVKLKEVIRQITATLKAEGRNK